MNQNKKLTSQERLAALGYSQQLKRTLSLKDNVGLTMAVVSPLMAVFILALSPLQLAGTASIPGMMLFSVVAICNGLVLAELISQYPISGGTYSCAKFSLPASLSSIVGLALAVQSVLVTSSITMGIATYIQLMFPILEKYNIGMNVLVVLILAISFFVCIKKIDTGKKVVIALLCIQLVIIGTFIIACFMNSSRSVVEVLSHLVMLDNGTLKEVGIKTILISIAPVFCVINGYDSSLGLAEETIGESKNVSKAVVISAAGAAVLITTTVLASAVAAPDMKSYLNAVSPFLYTAEAVMGPLGKIVMNLGVQVASLGALFSVITYYSRVLYAMGRDALFVKPINVFLSKVSPKENTPFAATALVIAISIIVACTASLESTVAGVGVLVAIVYMLTAFASIVNRFKKEGESRSFSMPLFPLPAMVVIVTALLVIYLQTMVLKLGLFVLVIVGIGLGYKQQKKQNKSAPSVYKMTTKS